MRSRNRSSFVSVAGWKGESSRVLHKAERRYCVTRKELLGVVEGVYNFHYYLYGSKYLIRIDHGALQWLNRPQAKPRAPMKIYNVGAPLERITVDDFGPLPVSDQGNKYVLVVADYFTKWTESYAMPNQEASTVGSS